MQKTKRDKQVKTGKIGALQYVRKFLYKNKFNNLQLFGKKSYGCGSCGMQFKDREDLLKHAEEIHDKNTIYQCITCEEDFENESSFRMHMIRNHKI